MNFIKNLHELITRIELFLLILEFLLSIPIHFPVVIIYIGIVKNRNTGHQNNYVGMPNFVNVFHNQSHSTKKLHSEMNKSCL